MCEWQRPFCNEFFRLFRPLNTEYVCACACCGWVCRVLVRVGLYVSVQYVLSLHLTSSESDVGGGGKKAHWTGLQRNGDLHEDRSQQVLLSYLAFSHSSSISSPSLVSGSANRNWQANAWEHSIALLLFDVCTDSHSRLFLRKPQGTALGTVNAILCILNLMELQSVQLFAKLEVAVAWLQFVTLTAQRPWQDHTSWLETSLPRQRTTIFMYKRLSPDATSSHEMVQSGIAHYSVSASWCCWSLDLFMAHTFKTYF